VCIANVSGEEFEEPCAGVIAGGDDQGGERQGGGGEGRKLVQAGTISANSPRVTNSMPNVIVSHSRLAG
jgi:hypothetical protein